MFNIIHKGFKFIFRHNKKVLTARLLHTLTSSVTFKCTKQNLSVANFAPGRVTQHLFTPVRLIYYLEEEESPKPYRRDPNALENTQEVIKEICFSENPESPEEWDNVKLEIMNTCFNLTHENFDSILMDVLLHQKNLQLGQSFMNYLKARRLKPNFVTLCKYMMLCVENVNQVGPDVVLETYEKIVSKIDTSVLDIKIVEFLVRGLCVTDKWQKSFEYVNGLQKQNLTNETLNALTHAALRNKDYKLAWHIMTDWYKKGVSPGISVYVEYMKFATDLHKTDPTQADSYVVQLFDYAQDRGVILKQQAALYIEDYFKRTGRYTTAYSKVSRNAICSVCRKELDPCMLTKEEFLYLKNSFLKFSLKKSDIFINTTDREFQRYCTFVEKFKPFDIVLDGLNIAYFMSSLQPLHFNGKKKQLPAGLLKAVDHLSNSAPRILVLGRHLMKKWHVSTMNVIKKKAFIFCVENSSQDDPYLIYAALASGPDSVLISCDMMRDHISRLPDPKLVRLFKKWQQSHQLYLKIRDNENQAILMEPLKHNIAVQGSLEMGFHIPFDNDFKREPYEELNNWLCIQKKS